MQDRRLQVFRNAVDELVESLDAFVRLSRWNDAEPRPAPLTQSVAKLHDRLGAADRLSAARFAGSPADVAKVDAMRTAMKRLSAAYVAYCAETRFAASSDDAVVRLESEVGATAAACGWR